MLSFFTGDFHADGWVSREVEDAVLSHKLSSFRSGVYFLNLIKGAFFGPAEQPLFRLSGHEPEGL